MPDTIKVLSYNIEFCASVNKGYWQYVTSFWKYLLPHKTTGLRQIATLINKENYDLCTFTEIDTASIRTWGMNYLKKLSNMTVLKHHHFYPVNGLKYVYLRGNGILTKYPIIDHQNSIITHFEEKRKLSSAKIDINGQIITVFTTQLSLGHHSRIEELKKIIHVIKNTQGPIILTGDFNTQNGDELKLIFENTLLQSVGTPETFPSWNPKRRIDYIFYSPEFEVIQSFSIPDLKISDHLPIVAELKIKK